MTDGYDFKRRSVIVTGAARGIGLELARHFAERGARTYLVDVDGEALEAAAAEIDGDSVPLVADVADTAAVEAAVTRVVEETGRLDAVVNNAGILRDAVLWKLSDEDWDAVLAVHLGGTFRLTRAAVPHFRAAGYGRVVNVTSYTGLHGNIGQANYAAAKAGIIGFTKTAAKELARFGITVNAISPNAETRMIESMPPEVYERSRQAIPLQRFGAPAEMAAAAGFLASEAAAYITGVVLPVDGGMAI